MHTGPVTVGNMGGGVVFNYAVHGDAVNTVARIEIYLIAYDLMVTEDGAAREVFWD